MYFNPMKNTLSIRRQQLHDRLEELLNSTLPGKRLPGMRALSEIVGARRTMLESELAALADRGSIRIEPRRGIFKARRPEKPAVWLFYEGAFLNTGSGFGFELLDELRGLAAAAGRRLATVQSTPERLPRWPEFFRAHHIEEAFLHGFSHEWFRQLAARACPRTVEILPRHTARRGFAVVDSPEMSVIQLDYLLKLQYRAIGYIHNAEQPREYSIVQHERLHSFYKVMAEHGLPVRREWVFSGYCAPKIFANRVDRMLNTKVEAVIVAGAFIPELYRVLRDRLCEPGRDLGIFSCDEIATPPDPEPAAVTNSPREIARTAWRLLEAARRGEPPCIEYSKLRIIIGNSLRHQE